MAKADRVLPAAEAHKLEDPRRLEWMPPDQVLANLPLRPGMAVADIGAGTGFFAIPMARALGPTGKVFAVDLQPGMLDLLAAKLSGPGAPANISLLQGSAEATSLPACSCDLVLLANVWHELPDHVAALQEARRILQPGGTLAILDWRPDTQQPPGPPRARRVAPDAVRHTVESHAYRCNLSVLIGSFSYLVVCSPASSR